MKVLLAVNNRAAEEWLAKRPEIQVVGIADSGKKSVALLQVTKPDALVTARAGKRGGVDDLLSLFAWLRLSPGLRVVVVAGDRDATGMAIESQARRANATVLSCEPGDRIAAKEVLETLLREKAAAP